MARALAKSSLVLLALGLWILACPASSAEDDDPDALHQQVNQLIEQGKYREAIPIAERAVGVSKRALGPEHRETADALNNLGFLFQRIGDKINTPVAAALLMSVIPANAVELSCQKSSVQLEQRATKNVPFVIQRLYPAGRVKSDCARAIQIAAQGDEAAMDKMIEQDRITFFAVGTLVYPVKNSGYRSVFIGPDLTTEMSTWWLVREKGSTEKWWISVRAFSAGDD